MKKVIVLASLIFVSAIRSADGNAMLAETDSKIYLSNAAFEMEIRAFDGNKLKESNRIAGYTKDGDKSLVLVYFISPSSVKGRKMLMEGNYIWMQMPRTKNAIRLSPMQILLGEASNGDVARTRFSADYSAVSAGSVNFQGKKCDKLELTVKNEKRGSTYSRITLYTGPDRLPVYGEFFAESGKMIKKVYYRSFSLYAGKMFPKQIEIFDAVNPQKHTIMEYVRTGVKALPQSYFTKDYLERFQNPSF